MNSVPSPDRTDSLMLALRKPPQKFDFIPVGALPRMNSRLRKYPDDDDYPRIRRFRNWDSWSSGSLSRQLSKPGVY